MRIETSELLIDVGHGTVLPVENPRGMRIVCVRGEIWITQDRRTEDVVLGPGQSFEASAGGALFVQALEDASVALHAPAKRQGGRSRLAAVLRWAAAARSAATHAAGGLASACDHCSDAKRARS